MANVPKTTERQRKAMVKRYVDFYSKWRGGKTFEERALRQVRGGTVEQLGRFLDLHDVFRAYEACVVRRRAIGGYGAKGPPASHGLPKEVLAYDRASATFIRPRFKPSGKKVINHTLKEMAKLIVRGAA